jgi:hypothetical protein
LSSVQGRIHSVSRIALTDGRNANS